MVAPSFGLFEASFCILRQHPNSGCTNAIRIPLDGTSLSNTQSTVIVWMDQKPMLINHDVLIFVDGNEVGTLTAKLPLKFAISPGHHRIYGSVPLAIRRQIEIDLKPGEVSFYELT